MEEEYLLLARRGQVVEEGQVLLREAQAVVKAHDYMEVKPEASYAF